jgi:pimeloyl-ACP methyl ester carboxylesterase
MAPIVFVHGVPETAALWDDVRAAIGRESVALSLPGFDSARPAGFSATKDAYCDWLVGELDAIGEPVDLVGHDWGAILTVRVATAFGDRVSSWVADVVNVFHERYVWHDFAQIWQTPDAGEEAMAAMRALPVAEGVQLLAGLGVPEAKAKEMWEAGDATMDQCILDLYRSAAPNVYADWGTAVAPTSAPGLIVSATADTFGDVTLATEMSARLGAPLHTFDGLGHWWMLQDPAGGAAAFEKFWAQG